MLLILLERGKNKIMLLCDIEGKLLSSEFSAKFSKNDTR